MASLRKNFLENPLALDVKNIHASFPNPYPEDAEDAQQEK
jgi:hypothetical protein